LKNLDLKAALVTIDAMGTRTKIAQAIRVLDVAFREDLARLRGGNTPANLAIIRHTALGLPSGARPTTSFNDRPEKAGWNVDYPEPVLRRAA
jgi:predicted transposase YbfD/YdcC